MMSLRRVFGLMLLFLFFEAVVAVVTTLWWHDTNVLLACLSMTALAVCVWAAFVLIVRLLDRLKTPKAPAAPRAFVPPVQNSPIVEDSFTQEMAALVAEANRRLVAVTLSSSNGQPLTVASLPLYLVMGAEGSGKTTAILNSGLEPRLLAGEAAHEGNAMPTRLANLWYAEGAIFAEISGRIVMQDPDRWEKALRILGAQRPILLWRRLFVADRRKPNLKGVLLACDTNPFVHAGDLQKLSSFARVLNERLQTVESTFRKDFPVYVLLTRCDAVQYFQEFFAHLSEPEGRRPLGVTLPLVGHANESADFYSERETKRLTQFFNRLYQSIADKRLVLLAREEVPAKKGLAYEFPRELKKVRGDLVQFLLDVFRPATLQTSFRLRGFYFIGKRLVPRANAALEAAPFDNSVAKRPTEATVFFGHKQQASAGDQSVFARRIVADTMVPKWSFLAELFREVILNDPAGLSAAPPPAGEERYRNIAFGAAGALCLLLSVVWVNAWQKNHRLLNEAQAAIELTPNANMPVGPGSLASLESIRPLLARLHEYDRHGAPAGYRWGLYVGTKADGALSTLYFNSFRQTILNPVLAAMSEHFLSLEPSTPVTSDVYKELKTYRIITSRNCKPETSLVSGTMLPIWSEAVSAQPDLTVLADKQIQFYTAELTIADPYKQRIPENGQAVGRAQAYLRDLKGPDKIMHALLSQVSREQAPESLSNYAINYSQVLTGPNEVEGAYTLQGWNAVQKSIHDHKLASSGEPCVVGGAEGNPSWTPDSTTDAAVQKLYSDSYLQQWKTYLAAHHVVPFSNSIDGAQKLRTLADNNRSPLLALVYMTSMNTNVAVQQTAGDRVAKNLQQLSNGAKTSIEKVFHKLDASGPETEPSSLQVHVAPTVLSEFKPVHAMVDPASSDKWLNETNQAYMKALVDLSSALSVLPARIDLSAPTDVQALTQAKAAIANATLALHSLEGTFPNTPARVDVDLKGLLAEPIDYAARTIHETPLLKAGVATVVAPVAAPAVPAGPSAHDLVKHTIEQVNTLERDLCSEAEAVQTKYPFDATATQDVTVDDLNQMFSPGTGALGRFSSSPDVSAAYIHQGRTWAAKPDFAATSFSQPFLFTLNNLSQLADELYGDGGNNPHFDYTLTLDGTGKIPFELDVDGHTLKYTPGKTSVPAKLVWPPLTNEPTRLIVKNGSKANANLPVQRTGTWSLLHLLQAADDQSGNVFTFRTVQFAHSLVPLLNDKGTEGTIQIRVESAASNIFNRGYLAKMRCDGSWAVH